LAEQLSIRQQTDSIKGKGSTNKGKDKGKGSTNKGEDKGKGSTNKGEDKGEGNEMTVCTYLSRAVFTHSNV